MHAFECCSLSIVIITARRYTLTLANDLLYNADSKLFFSRKKNKPYVTTTTSLYSFHLHRLQRRGSVHDVNGIRPITSTFWLDFGAIRHSCNSGWALCVDYRYPLKTPRRICILNGVQCRQLSWSVGRAVF